MSKRPILGRAVLPPVQTIKRISSRKGSDKDFLKHTCGVFHSKSNSPLVLIFHNLHTRHLPRHHAKKGKMPFKGIYRTILGSLHLRLFAFGFGSGFNRSAVAVFFGITFVAARPIFNRRIFSTDMGVGLAA